MSHYLENNIVKVDDKYLRNMTEKVKNFIFKEGLKPILIT